MTNPDKKLEELIKERNDFEAQLALIKSKWEEASGDIQVLLDIQPQDFYDGSFQVDGQSVNELMRAING